MKLAPAGSGLPNVERLFIKNLLVPTIRIFITWDIALFLLQRELKIIDKILKPINEDLLTKKIIINRTFAIEDDSRQFSINMVLEHLEIAGNKVKNIIETLSLEKEFVEDLKIENCGSTVCKYLTISIGLVSKESSEIINSDKLYKEADDNLYEAKRLGRNCIYIQ